MPLWLCLQQRANQGLDKKDDDFAAGVEKEWRELSAQQFVDDCWSIKACAHFVCRFERNFLHSVWLMCGQELAKYRQWFRCWWLPRECRKVCFQIWAPVLRHWEPLNEIGSFLLQVFRHSSPGPPSGDAVGAPKMKRQQQPWWLWLIVDKLLDPFCLPQDVLVICWDALVWTTSWFFITTTEITYYITMMFLIWAALDNYWIFRLIIATYVT